MKKFYLLIFFICMIPMGVVLGLNMNNLVFFEKVLLYVGILISLILSVFIHELGHLVFGLLTGYSFISFRIGSYVFYKNEDGKIKRSKTKAPGIAGQCLMYYDKDYRENMPFYWYNMGGGIFNFLSALVAAIPTIIFIDNGIVFALCFCFVFVSIALGATSIFYISEIGDGANLHYLLEHDQDSLKGFYDQLLYSNKMSENIEFKDIDFQEYEYNSFSALAITAYILKMYEYCAKGKIAEAVLISDYLEKGINNISKLLRTSVSLEIIIFKATKLKDTSNVKEIIETLPKSQQRQMKKIKEISFLLGYIVYLVYGLKDYEKVKECILQEEKLIENNYQKPLANYYREILENIKQDIILNNE